MSEGIRSITAGLQKSLSMIAKSQQDEFNQDQVNRRIVAKGIIANRNKTLGFNLERDLQLQISQQLLETDFETWWGRGCSGQAIKLDYNIQKIAYEYSYDERLFENKKIA